MDFLNQVPEDILLKIIEYANIEEFVNLKSTCKNLHKILNDKFKIIPKKKHASGIVLFLLNNNIFPSYREKYDNNEWIEWIIKNDNVELFKKFENILNINKSKVFISSAYYDSINICSYVYDMFFDENVFLNAITYTYRKIGDSTKKINDSKVYTFINEKIKRGEIYIKDRPLTTLNKYKNTDVYVIS